MVLATKNILIAYLKTWSSRLLLTQYLSLLMSKRMIQLGIMAMIAEACLMDSVLKLIVRFAGGHFHVNLYMSIPTSKIRRVTADAKLKRKKKISKTLTRYARSLGPVLSKAKPIAELLVTSRQRKKDCFTCSSKTRTILARSGSAKEITLKESVLPG